MPKYQASFRNVWSLLTSSEVSQYETSFVNATEESVVWLGCGTLEDGVATGEDGEGDETITLARFL